MELARVPKMRPRTRTINIRFHHFREHVRLGLIFIHAIPTEEMIAYCLNKSLPKDTLAKNRFSLMGWNDGNCDQLF
jgi:hypothetical protein